MCAVSAVTDYYREQWQLVPGLITSIDTAAQPAMPFVPPLSQMILKPGVMVTQEQWAEYQELKRRMEEYDARTGQPDCIKPEVAEWEAVVEASIQK